ncbi:RecQ family ATP-dependent DNA helicase (plasmid) [Croceicoccus marinus]|uniref:DNA 3'-5' helicase n=1 Tax=Croceicoccus marinus TaxID=450378 RepID=A0A7G6W0X3_9SPHN|nr:RecQ family ATP-dependent DNA helicase [Croceicoccus marinus]
MSFDIEVDPKTAKIFAFAAVRYGDGAAIRAGKGGLARTLDEMESGLSQSDHCIGHNILHHDLPHLAAVRPNLGRIVHAPIDTLWLNPLAFPRNPYHHLVKHHLDGRLQAGHLNDPAKDAELVFRVLEDQLQAFRKMAAETPDAMAAYHFLVTLPERSAGFDAVFRASRQSTIPTQREAELAIRRMLEGNACNRQVVELLNEIASPRKAWPTAYALSWVTVAGGNSVMPPWVRKQFPEAADIVRDLRDSDCRGPDCAWCRTMNNPRASLQRWFGYDSFRPKPADKDGRPLQERIVEEAMHGQSLLGILPTGTGKSVCYQIPALANFEKIGSLTVVISPLVALMGDQVHGMTEKGISSAVTINGMLSMPERQDALDKVRMGDASILIISPEQLRSVSVRDVLKTREVGLWALDEAHCVSKWGHDFRPDYRYVGRFIKEFSGDRDPSPILCLTATAKPEVVRDICGHFHERVGSELLLLDGGAVRTNLTFEVRQTGRSTKLSDILNVIEAKLPAEGASGAVIYCSSRRQTELVAEFLQKQGMAADFFHAGLTPEKKKEVQERFRVGALRIIAATNAFGMGIDKPDIRLVVHGDIPGSLENYLQEAGRAGRDREHADCVLLFADDDVERQFTLSARSRLARHEIGAILKALRRLDDKTTRHGDVVATSGEIVRAEQDYDFERDKLTDDTRVKTAVAWLEEGKLLAREENRVRIFPASLTVPTLKHAEDILAKAAITGARRKQLVSIVRHLMSASPDEGISTDELAGVSGLSPRALPKALHDLEVLGIARDDTAITVFIHAGVEGQSSERLRQAASLEAALIDVMREAEPDAEGEGAFPLQLSQICQKLRDEGHEKARPDIIDKMLRGLAQDGRDEDGGRGNLYVRKQSRDTLYVKLQRSWDTLARTASIRRDGAENLLKHFVGKLPKGKRGKDLQVETTIGALTAVITSDVFLRTEVKAPTKLLNRAMLWMHEQEIMTLGKGLTVFRQAMTIHLRPGNDKFTRQNFMPLEDHYSEQTIQTHVMAAYARKGLISIKHAQHLSEDYFTLDQDTFLDLWLPGERIAIRRQTTPASWQAIVEDLGNPVQQKIVSDDREQTNVLVLAGPGSGKTRTLVHRIAYLIRVRRENPNGILVLSYNRHAVTEIRARLRQLIGDDAKGVTVSTCHALAMRLVGASFVGAPADNHAFDEVINEAVRQLQGEGLSKSEAEAQRDALIQGYRWILVDEYQDIGPEAYSLIGAVAGRSQDDPDMKLSLFAVGDDDQNIYAFDGASVEYIRRFEQDYRAKPEFLTENYRSTRHIIDAANSVIAPATERMKLGHDITINRVRVKEAAGGAMARLDPVGQGRVQVLSSPGTWADRACAAVDELIRLSNLDPDWDWSKTAIIARSWKLLEPVRSYAESKDIPVELANEHLPSIWRLRETQLFIEHCKADTASVLGVEAMRRHLERQPANRWTGLLSEGLDALVREIGESEMAVPDLVEWIAEWCRDTRGDQRGLLLLTAHRAKGLEFDDVVILDGDWTSTSRGEDSDAPRRLFYVAMTRARRSLAVMANGQHPYVSSSLEAVLSRDVEPALRQEAGDSLRYQLPDMELVDLSYAGRLMDRNPALQAIAKAKVGDPIQLVPEGQGWFIKDITGQTIGRMRKSYRPPDGYHVESIKIGAIVRWRKSDNAEEFREYIRRDEWETVLPDIVFAQAGGPTPN